MRTSTVSRVNWLSSLAWLSHTPRVEYGSRVCVQTVLFVYASVSVMAVVLGWVKVFRLFPKSLDKNPCPNDIGILLTAYFRAIYLYHSGKSSLL